MSALMVWVADCGTLVVALDVVGDGIEMKRSNLLNQTIAALSPCGHPWNPSYHGKYRCQERSTLLWRTVVVFLGGYCRIRIGL
jgi:hypothetical protein